jgi:HK97 family phage portal protein
VSLLRRAFEQRAVTSFGPMSASASGLTVPSNSEQWGVTSGVPVNDTSALQLSAFYACVRLLADSIASLPWDSYRRQGSLRLEVDPQPSLLLRPDASMTVFDWKHVMVVSLAMRGNFYGLVTERDRLEYPTSIMPLHPDQVRVDRDPDTGRRRVWVGGQVTPLENLFHIKAFSLPGADEGLSPVAMARQSLGLGLAAEQFGARWFADGAAPSSVLETDANLDDAQVRRTQQQWISSHGGRRRPAVLSGGIRWKPITISPEESQFLETRKMQVSEVARIFGVPPHMIGDVEKSTSWGTGIEQQGIGFVTYTLRPWLTRIEAALTDVVPRGQFVRFNVDGLLRGDIKTRYEAYRVAIEGGWRNPDEVRALEDLPPIPGGAGAKYRQPLNFGPLGADPTEVAEAAPVTPLRAVPDE